MKLLNRRTGSALALSLSGALWMSAQTAQAQSAVNTTSEGHFQVELRDASLADALEMIFKAAGNPPHQIDASAQTVNIGFVTFPSIRFDSLLLNLTRANNFRVVKERETGVYIITPRTPPPVDPSVEGGAPADAPGGFNGFPAAPMGGGVPTNPFGQRTLNDQQISPFGRSSGSDATKDYHPIRVQHLSASGIAQLFGGTIITTEDFLGLNNSGSGGSGGSGGGFGGGFGGSGFGASSIGGSTGGFGGGGGGDSSGFGGGSTGGFGGDSTGGLTGGGGGDTSGSNGVGF